MKLFTLFLILAVVVFATEPVINQPEDELPVGVPQPQVQEVEHTLLAEQVDADEDVLPEAIAPQFQNPPQVPPPVQINVGEAIAHGAEDEDLPPNPPTLQAPEWHHGHSPHVHPHEDDDSDISGDED